MTIVVADVKGLEVVAAAYLSQDEILCNEIRNKVDIHEKNRERFNLPSRLIAKTYFFRLLYGGSANAYCYDPEFNWISKSQDYWQEVIDTTYAKYEGLQMWHRSLMHEAQTTGRIECPTGRFFPFQPYLKRGEWQWPRTNILNYPVQGLGADLVALGRVEFANKFREEKIDGVLISSVHDSIVCDVPRHGEQRCSQLLSESVGEIPRLFRNTWGLEFDLPLFAEIKIGPNFKDLVEI